MSNFIKRSLTAVLFGTVLIAGINLHMYGFYTLFLAITLLGTREFYQLSEKAGASPQKGFGLIGGAILYTACFFNALTHETWYFLPLGIFIASLFIVEMYRKKDNPFTNIAFTIMGLIYVGLPFSILNYLAFPFSDQLFHPELVMGIFVMIWANDTGAYLVGVKWGKHRLFERISPKKSWEGSIGGLISAILVGWIISMVCSDLSLLHWEIIALIVVVFGSFGDLVESLFKRSIQIKDSGTILPGHGGILDRFDAVFLAAPMVFLYLQLIKEFFH